LFGAVLVEPTDISDIVQKSPGTAGTVKPRKIQRLDMHI
jgi:hypothetical protein